MKRIINFALIFWMLLLFGSISVSAYDSYHIGDIINFKGEDYYVINDSDENREYVTVFKVKSLTTDELYTYGVDLNKYVYNFEGQVYEFADGSGGISYYSNYGCSLYYNVNNYYCYDIYI